MSDRGFDESKHRRQQGRFAPKPARPPPPGARERLRDQADSEARREPQTESVDDLIAQRRIERVPPNRAAIRDWVNDANRHLRSAETLADSDPRLAYAACHDAVRKALTAHMSANGLRPRAGEGAHVTVIAYGRERLQGLIGDDVLDELDTLRRVRRIAEYGEAPSSSVDAQEVRAAIPVARTTVDAIQGWFVNSSDAGAGGAKPPPTKRHR